jgi:hypothetical protein
MSSRLDQCVSKKIENHAAMVALYFVHCSFPIGGLFSSTVLTLFLLPVLYDWVFEGRHKPEVEV